MIASKDLTNYSRFASDNHLSSVDKVQQFHRYCCPNICMYTI